MAGATVMGASAAITVLTTTAAVAPAVYAAGATDTAPTNYRDGMVSSVRSFSPVQPRNVSLTTESQSTTVEADSSWGGVETLTIGYQKSPAEQKAWQDLKSSVDAATGVLSSSEGDVADDSTRTALKASIDQANDLLGKPSASPDDLNGRRSSVDDAKDKVNASVSEKQAADAAAATAAASRSSARRSLSGGGYSSAPSRYTVESDGSAGAELANYALSFVGKVPYVWAGSSTSGWDCSGFVMFVYAHKAGIQLPHYSGAQATMGQAVASLDQARPGDIIANGTHAAIYIGNGQVVNALNPGAGTVVTPVSWAFTGGYSIRRLI